MLPTLQLGLLIGAMALGCAARTGDPAEPQRSTPTRAPAASQPSSKAAGTPAPIAPIRGPTCLPVAQCASFAAPRCVVLRFDDHGNRLEPGPELEFVRAWPGEAGVGPSITTVMDYLESQSSCRRRPELAMPGFDCALEAGICVVQTPD